MIPSNAAVTTASPAETRAEARGRFRLAHPLAGRFPHVFRLGERGPCLAEAGVDLVEFLTADRFLGEHHLVAPLRGGREFGAGRCGLVTGPCGLLGLARFGHSRLGL